MLKRQLNLKHLKTHVTDEEDLEICKIASENKISYLEAKEIFFEQQKQLCLTRWQK